MNVGLPLVLRDLELYEDILFDYYLKANDNHGFETLIQRLSTNPEFYRLWSEQSRTGHRFYSKESVGQMWEKFYDDMANYESSEDYDNHSQAAN
jgi:1,2-diacylglycerol-3-alpha-glucose alpha-1,2-galactosyltransferase